MPNDILLDENFNPIIENGDLLIGESTYQHQKCLLITEKADLKEFPTSGVASKRYLETENPDNYAREIRQEFMADGMVFKSLQIKENLEINIDAQYQ